MKTISKFGLLMILSFFMTTVSFSQCIQYQTKKGKSCGNPESLDVKVTNNCSKDQYVMALCIGENLEVKKIFGFEVEAGETRGNWTCHGTNLTVRYWDIDPNDPYGAYRSAKKWYNDCKERNYID